eukprot:6207585-Pleurochrysis_carterae.AAC.1
MRQFLCFRLDLLPPPTPADRGTSTRGLSCVLAREGGVVMRADGCVGERERLRFRARAELNTAASGCAGETNWSFCSWPGFMGPSSTDASVRQGGST